MGRILHVAEENQAAVQAAADGEECVCRRSDTEDERRDPDQNYEYGRRIDRCRTSEVGGDVETMGLHDDI